LNRCSFAAPGGPAPQTSADPSQADRSIDIFKLGALPQIEQLEGFCSASLLVNRATAGRPLR
jgi:hypothetical protein